MIEVCPIIRIVNNFTLTDYIMAGVGSFLFFFVLYRMYNMDN